MPCAAKWGERHITDKTSGHLPQPHIESSSQPQQQHFQWPPNDTETLPDCPPTRVVLGGAGADIIIRVVLGGAGADIIIRVVLGRAGADVIICGKEMMVCETKYSQLWQIQQA